jgi:hypothetical protein
VDLSDAVWRKSSRSGANGCVEVALVSDRIAVRDSKDPHGPTLLFTAHEWQAFLTGIRAGEFGQATDSPPWFQPPSPAVTSAPG